MLVAGPTSHRRSHGAARTSPAKTRRTWGGADAAKLRAVSTWSLAAVATSKTASRRFSVTWPRSTSSSTTPCCARFEQNRRDIRIVVSQQRPRARWRRTKLWYSYLGEHLHRQHDLVLRQVVGDRAQQRHHAQGCAPHLPRRPCAALRGCNSHMDPFQGGAPYPGRRAQRRGPRCRRARGRSGGPAARACRPCCRHTPRPAPSNGTVGRSRAPPAAHPAGPPRCTVFRIGATPRGLHAGATPHPLLHNPLEPALGDGLPLAAGGQGQRHRMLRGCALHAGVRTRPKESGQRLAHWLPCSRACSLRRARQGVP